LRLFILYFHSGNERDYQILPEVLRWLHREKIIIVSALEIANRLVAGTLASLPPRCCALTFDDGMDLDFEDVMHPVRGHQPAFATIMREFEEECARDSESVNIHATSFVIASPLARAQIQERELLGYPWMSDRWWRPAVASGRFYLGNHSWDHVSQSVDTVKQRDQKKGDFAAIDNYDDANAQIRKAREMIEMIAPNPGISLFCYPYGHRNDYLVREYFPRHMDEHKTLAAFTCVAEPVTADTNRWEIPRYGFEFAWRSIEDLAYITRG
jgi:peptidoglycan/xylan/chitin deacetylase (PgdA/CDA1 family)